MTNALLTVALVGVTAVWGWTFVMVRDAVAVYGVLAFLAIRFTIASLCLAGFLPFSVSPLIRGRLTPATWKMGVRIGVSLAVGYVFQTTGQRFTTPTNSGLITGLFVVFTPVLDWVLYRAYPSRSTLIAVTAGVAGMLLLTGQSPEALRFGDLLTLSCAAAFGLHIVLLSRHAPNHDPLALAFVQLLTCAALFTGAWLAFEPLVMPPREVWFALVVTGVVASALGFFVQTTVQRRLPAVRAAVIITMEPLFATFFGYVLAGDRLKPVQLLGAGLILSALAIGEVFPLFRRKGTGPAKSLDGSRTP